MLIASISAFDLAIAANAAIEARIVAEELIPGAFFGGSPVDGYEWHKRWRQALSLSYAVCDDGGRCVNGMAIVSIA